MEIAKKKIDLDSLRLEDVIDIEVLQRFQDDFAKGMGLASVTVDQNGVPVTRPSGYTNFCLDYTHSTEVGDKRCAKSHKRGGEEAARLGKPFVYECHAGLIDFAAPIILEGHLLGTMLGGQVLINKPVTKNMRRSQRKSESIRRAISKPSTRLIFLIRNALRLLPMCYLSPRIICLSQPIISVSCRPLLTR